MRDDFPAAIKELLAKRVGFGCSNPSCRQPTSGPQMDPKKVVNVGVAAHITAASPDGPRYNPAMTAEERKAADNGVWLCQKCGKLVDNDTVRYDVAMLREWKRQAEEIAIRELEGGGPSRSEIASDRTIAIRDLSDQLESLARILQEDLHRLKLQGDNHGGKLEALIGSADKRIQDLRWKHPGGLLLVPEASKKFQGILLTIDGLRGRDSNAAWHACFSLISIIRETAALTRLGVENRRHRED